MQGLKGIGGGGGCTLDLPVSTKLTTVNICTMIEDKIAKIALSAGASTNNGCSLKTMLYENSTVTSTRIKQNVFKINAFVSASSCSGVLCAIFRFVKKFWAILFGHTNRRLAVNLFPILWVLAKISPMVVTRHQQKS